MIEYNAQHEGFAFNMLSLHEQWMSIPIAPLALPRNYSQRDLECHGRNVLSNEPSMKQV